MNEKQIQEIGLFHFGEIPTKIIRKKIGICNEVYELKYNLDSYILRMNKEKEFLYGTHKFLPLFKELQIKTPRIIGEDYSKTKFQFCFQILTKLDGADLGLVINNLSPIKLKEIALEISNIFDQFKSLPVTNGFGTVTGLKEDNYSSLLEVFENQKETILERNKLTNVLEKETLAIHHNLLSKFKNYLLHFQPKLYYDDICSKNVMIHNGKFSGLVDLDFLMKGDYLEAIGRIKASWFGEAFGETYVNEIIRLQKLDKFQQKIINLYAILNLIYWASEEGIKFNSNSTGEISWDNVKRKKIKIAGLLKEIN